MICNVEDIAQASLFGSSDIRLDTLTTINWKMIQIQQTTESQ